MRSVFHFCQAVNPSAIQSLTAEVPSLNVRCCCSFQGPRRPTGSCCVNVISSDSSVNDQKQLRVKKKASFSFLSPFLLFFPPSLCSITPSHVSALFCCLEDLPASFFPLLSNLPPPVLTHSSLSNLCSETCTHRVSYTVLPGLPLLAVPAVFEAVCSGELIPRVSGVSSLSPNHRQEGQPAQIHLNNTSAGFSKIM